MGRIRSESGATMMEYALVMTLIAFVVLVAVGLFGEEIVRLFQAAADAF